MHVCLRCAAAFASMHEPRLAVRDYTESIRLDPGQMRTYRPRRDL
jgi:hypothetical protein